MLALLILGWFAAPVLAVPRILRIAAESHSPHNRTLLGWKWEVSANGRGQMTWAYFAPMGSRVVREYRPIQLTEKQMNTLAVEVERQQLAQLRREYPVPNDPSPPVRGGEFCTLAIYREFAPPVITTVQSPDYYAEWGYLYKADAKRFGVVWKMLLRWVPEPEV